MRLIIIGLALVLLLIQFPLWLGKGGWLYVSSLDRQVAAQRAANAELEARNDRLAGELRDLRDGTGAVEERARSEFGMMRDGEVFVQYVAPSSAPVAVAASAAH